MDGAGRPVTPLRAEAAPPGCSPSEPTSPPPRAQPPEKLAWEHVLYKGEDL